LSGDVAEGIVVSKVNSEGIVAGCDFFQSLGETIRTSFGRLRIRSVKKTEPNVLSLAPTALGLTSVVTNNPRSTVCH
jgi:hypothetical protein